MRKNVLTICLVLAFGLVVNTTRADLIAHWELDGNANDSIGTKHGTIHGATPTAGRIGGAYSFNGVDNYIALPNNEPIWLPQNDFSIACWVYFERETGAAFEVLLDLNFADSSDPSGENGYDISRSGSTGKLGFALTTTTNSDEDLWSNSVMLKDEWYHIIAIRNGTQQKIYINGLLDNSRTCTPDPINFVSAYDDDTVNIGAVHRKYYTSHDHHFKGSIDDIRIYNHALGEQEIAEIIPEPATLLLFGIGAALLRKRR